jgi:hypothetical protein
VTSQESSWRGWLIPGFALVIAAVVIVLALRSTPVPGPQTSSAPSESEAPSHTAADDHILVTPDETLEFRQEGSSLVVRRLSGGQPTELARIGANLESPKPGQTPATSTTSFYVIVCGAETGNPMRYIVGHLTGRLPFTYQGPPAVGQGASDGLFLYRLDVGPINDQDPIRIQTADKLGLVGLGGGTFKEAVSDGAKQPSGCWVLG